MAVRTKMMTEGNPFRLILFFALPLMAGNVFQQFYTIVDTAVVGRFVGVSGLSALGAVDWLVWLFVGMSQGITQGFSILTAQYFGAQDQKMLNRTVGASATLSLCIAIFFLLLGHGIAQPILMVLNTPNEIFPLAMQYLRIVFMGIPFVVAYNFSAAILRALGDSRTPLLSMVVGSIINVALDLLFVVGFDWGIAGAAFATIIAQFIAVFYCFRQLRKVSLFSLKRSDFLPSASMVKSLLRMGSPIAFQNAVICFGGMVVQTIVNGYGVSFIAGFTASNKLYGLLEIAATSYGHAVTTYVGQNAGAKRVDRIKIGMRKALLLSLITSLFISLIIFLFGKQILSLFIDPTAEGANVVMDIAYTYLRIMAAFLFILYALHVYRSALLGMGNAVIPMASGFAELLMRIAVALFLPMALGQFGIFFAEVAAWTGGALLLMIAYYKSFPHYAQKFSGDSDR